MSKATAVVTARYKNTFVRTASAAQREVALRSYLAMGFRVDRYDPARNNVTVNTTYLRVDGDGSIMYDTCSETPREHRWLDVQPVEVYLGELEAAATRVRAIKRIESKAQKKRSAIRKWSATATMHVGRVMPCAGSTLVAIRCKNGTTFSGRAEDFDWGRNPAWAYEISSYKVLTPNKHKPKPVKVEKVDVDTMMADIAGDLGKEVAKVPAKDSKGWINWDASGFVSDNSIYKEGVMHGPALYGAKIDVKWRNGKVILGATNGVTSGAAGVFWSNDNKYNDIVAYRLVPEVLKVESLSSVGGAVGSLMSGNFRQADNPNWCVGCDPDNCSGCPDVPVVPDTNPKKQYGVASIPLEMWPDLASAYGALGLYNGSLKYGKANYANTPVEASIYIAAARRHLAAWCAGEEFDPADDVPNLGGVLANIAILIEARAAGTLIDDRMLQSGYLKERDALKAKVKPLQVLHADKNPKHFTREQ